MAVLVLIPYRARARGGSDERARNADVVWSWWHHLGLRPVIGDDPNPGTFNRGRALNAAVVRAQPKPGDVLVLSDADLIPDFAALERAVGMVALGHAGMVVPFTEVRYLSERASIEVHAAAAELPDHPELDGVWDRLSTGGLNVLSFDLFAAVDGFDPRFTGWGFEDAAFDAACSTLGQATVHLPGPIHHLWHPPARDSNHPTYEPGLALCRRYETAAGDPEAMRALIKERA